MYYKYYNHDTVKLFILTAILMSRDKCDVEIALVENPEVFVCELLMSVVIFA